MLRVYEIANEDDVFTRVHEYLAIDDPADAKRDIFVAEQIVRLVCEQDPLLRRAVLKVSPGETTVGKEYKVSINREAMHAIRRNVVDGVDWEDGEMERWLVDLDTVEGAVAQLSAAERQDLVRLLEAELEGSTS